MFNAVPVSPYLFYGRHQPANTSTPLSSLFERRALSEASSSLHPRVQYALPCTICVSGTQTYVVINAFEALSGTMGTLIQALLDDTIAGVNGAVAQMGDILVPGGCLQWIANGVQWVSINSNNHQQTYNVALAAVKAVQAFMASSGQFGFASFLIYDGTNQVGGGQVSRQWYGPLDSSWPPSSC